MANADLAGSSVWPEGTQQHAWVLVETRLSEPEGTGQGECMRWSQRLGGQLVLWNTLILPEMSNEVAKLPHVVGTSQGRLTHLWVNRTESQFVGKKVQSPRHVPHLQKAQPLSKASPRAASLE